MRSSLVILLLAFASSSPAQACRQNYPKLDSKLASLDLSINTMNDDFAKLPADIRSKEWVKTKLQHMFEVDQAVRNAVLDALQQNYPADELQCAKNEIVSRMASVDAQDTTDMKQILEIYGWLKISEFGSDADTRAWLIIQHADHDPEFQKSVLVILEKLWRVGETNPQNFAYLFDRVASSWNDPTKRVPQRYGTQGSCATAGDWEPLPIDDISNLDARRAEVKLPPFSEYKKLTDTMCH